MIVHCPTTLYTSIEALVKTIENEAANKKQIIRVVPVNDIDPYQLAAAVAAISGKPTGQQPGASTFGSTMTPGSFAPGGFGTPGRFGGGGFTGGGGNPFGGGGGFTGGGGNPFGGGGFGYPGGGGFG